MVGGTLEKLLNGLTVSRQHHSTIYFTYSSPPRPIHFFPRNKRYRNNVPRPRGIHDYFNLMWDPHICRGSTVKVQTAYSEPANQSKFRGRGESSDDGPINTRVRKKRSSNLFRNRPPKPPSYTNGMGRSNLSNSSSPATGGINGRLHSMIQTDNYLEELGGGGETTEESSDATVQTDEIYEMCLPSYQFIPQKTGIDASTQILPNELFDFDAEVEPILESLIGNILEQSMYEVVQEEELSAIKEQTNRFQQQRKQEEKVLRQLQEQKEKIDAEKERLKKQLELEHVLGFENGVGVVQRGETTTSSSSIYSTSYILELLPSVLNSLRQEGFLTSDLLLSNNEGDDTVEVEPSSVIVEEVTISSVKEDDNAGGGVDEVFANNTMSNNSTNQGNDNEEGMVDSSIEKTATT